MSKKLPDIDPLGFLPIRYEDRRQPVPSNHFQAGDKVLAAGRLNSMSIFSRKGGRMLTATIDDEGGYFIVKYFNWSRMTESILSQRQRTVYFWGVPKRENNLWVFVQPVFPADMGSILPVYKTHRGISESRLRAHVWNTTQRFIETIKDEVDPAVLAHWGMPSIVDALRQIHFPTDKEPGAKAFERIAYREIFDIKKRIASMGKQRATVHEADCERGRKSGEVSLFSAQEPCLRNADQSLNPIADSFQLDEIESTVKVWRKALGIKRGAHLFKIPDSGIYRKVVKMVDSDLCELTHQKAA